MRRGDLRCKGNRSLASDGSVLGAFPKRRPLPSHFRFYTKVRPPVRRATCHAPPQQSIRPSITSPPSSRCPDLVTGPSPSITPIALSSPEVGGSPTWRQLIRALDVHACVWTGYPSLGHFLPLPCRRQVFKMRSWIALGAALPFAHAIRIIHSNDDGWAEINARTFFNSLVVAGHNVVLSAPAENQSGTG